VVVLVDEPPVGEATERGHGGSEVEAGGGDDLLGGRGAEHERSHGPQAVTVGQQP
jgi:hypothetical protein